MAEHGLAPAFVKIFYHSQWGPHVMTRQTLAWTPPIPLFPQGNFQCWDGIPRNADTMITDLVNLMAPNYAATSAFDRYEIWTKVADADPGTLVVSKSLGIVGTTTFTGWEAAVQKTYSLRTAANNIFRFVLLDSPSDNVYLKYYTLNSVDAAMVAELQATNRPWAARADDQPIFFRDASVTLNKVLSAKYARR